MASVIAFTVPVRQLSPLYIARRDIAFSGGDDIEMQITVKVTDGGAAVDVTGADITARVTRPQESCIVLEKTGVVVNGPTGRINVSIDSDDTVQMAGEYMWDVRIALASGDYTTLRGMMIVHPRLGESAFGDFILTEGGDFILIEG